MRSQHLRSLVDAQGPFASVYFDDSHDSQDAVEQVETTWHVLRKHLEEQGTTAGVIGRLEDAVLRHRPAVGRRGRALIASDERLLVDEYLISPPPSPSARWSDYPYVLPLIELEMCRPTYVFAAVSHAGADVVLDQDGVITSTSVDGGGYPVHKPATAGWSGYGDLQRTTEEAVRMNVRAIADSLTRLVDEAQPEVVFVRGELRARTDVVSALPKRVAQRVSQLHSGAQKRRLEGQEIRDLVAAEFDTRRRVETSEIAARFRAELGRGSGLAAEGLGPVCAALRDGDVDTLIVAALGDATVVTGKSRTTVAPDPDALSELGEPVERIARADEALPFAAIAIGAALVRADSRTAPSDGIGALLRYVTAGGALTNRKIGRK